jgi:hypothetical protein
MAKNDHDILSILSSQSRKWIPGRKGKRKGRKKGQQHDSRCPGLK